MSTSSNSLTSADIRAVCRKTIDIFGWWGLDCCLMGSAATALWGASRVANDVDLVVMTADHTEERLKLILAEEDSDYELRSSTNPRNSYKIAWCRVPGSPTKKCKVDVLVPGVMNIPFIPPVDFVWFSDHTQPSMPLLPLLLLKLQGWDDHRRAPPHRLDLLAKQYVDILDINELLLIAEMEGINRHDGVAVLPASFLSAADSRVRAYMQANPMSEDIWRTIGFSTEHARSLLQDRPPESDVSFNSLDDAVPPSRALWYF